MKRTSLAFLSALFAVFAVTWPAIAEQRIFVTHLSGDEEVPLRETLAQGQAVFHLREDGTQLEYFLIVANIENVVAAHIHVGAEGINGPVVAFLFGPAPPGGGQEDGPLAQGTITAANLVGPLAGQPLSALIAEITAGNTYVNVHTDDGVPPPTQVPGIFRVARSGDRLTGRESPSNTRACAPSRHSRRLRWRLRHWGRSIA